jgi:GntR family transcriptional regulator of arabinose operon
MTDIDKPKYQRLKEYIISTIKTGTFSPGEKYTSENELADRFEISRHTVRQAIGELTNERWLYRVQGKGTFVNRPPDEEKDKPRTLGVITTYLSDYIFPSIIKGIDGVLSLNGYNIVLGCTNNDHEKERQTLKNMFNQNIGGLIVEPTRSALPNPNINLYRELNSTGIPILFIHGCYKELQYSYIVEDDTLAGYLAASHLIELGHKKIGGIFKADDIQGQLRYAGFHNAHKKAGLKTSASRILWFSTDDIEKKISTDDNRLNNLLTECTAIVCYNDQTAVRLMDEIRSRELNIPEDISLVSFDDSQLAVASEIKLTTVAHPKEILGEESAKAMINMIDRKKDYYDIKMEPKLIIRSSIKCIR